MTWLGMRNRYATHIDFSFLRGVIKDNPKAMPSNIDMVFERKGKFLFGEWKRTDEGVTLGQEILLKALAKHPDNTVLIITGHTDKGAYIKDIKQMCPFGKLIHIGNSVETLKTFINNWYEKVNK